VNSPTQMMSSACQKQGRKHNRRRSTVAAKPLNATCAIITTSQIRPTANVQPVAADEREGRSGEKRAALWRGAIGDHRGELADLERQEGGAKHQVTTAPI